jgi:hypothetical protein
LKGLFELLVGLDQFLLEVLAQLVCEVPVQQVDLAQKVVEVFFQADLDRLELLFVV